MKPENYFRNWIKAAVVIAVALAFIAPSAAVVTNTISTTTHALDRPDRYQCELPSVHESMSPGNTVGMFEDDDVLISASNPDEDDRHPKVAMNSEGVPVVVYEQVKDIITTTIPVVSYDADSDTWLMVFEFDSTDFPEGSGELLSPDIKYNPNSDEFFWTAIDQLATMYNEHTAWIPGDILNADAAVWWAISGQDSSDYTDGALTYVGEWFLGFAIHTGYDIEACPGIGYFYYDADTETVLFPNEVDASWAAGYYYDGQSVLETAPAGKPEMATGENRLYMVMETNNSKISLKSTVSDLDPESDTFLFTSGGGPSGMDKYADIEVWPWQLFVEEINATDPDISASGTNAVTVYTHAGDVVCTYTTDDGENWDTTTVAGDAGYAAVYLVGNTAYCVYVKDGNLWLDTSEDAGATWSGEPLQVNDVDGTVIAEPGTADIHAGGIVWMDSRNGPADIYWNRFLSLSPDIPVPDGPSQVKVNEETEFCATTSDPQGDDVYYLFDWGDGTDSGWIGPFESGEEGCASHSWDAQGDYELRVKAKDDADHESEWSPTVPITVPKNKPVPTMRFLDLMEMYFPGLYRMLGILLG